MKRGFQFVAIILSLTFACQGEGNVSSAKPDIGSDLTYDVKISEDATVDQNKDASDVIADLKTADVGNDLGSSDANVDVDQGMQKEPPKSVYYLGHSLMSDKFATMTQTANESAGMVHFGVLSRGGFSASRVIDEVRTDRDNWVGAEAIVLDYIINGTESGEQFLTDARALNAYIKTENPDVRLIWVEGHACDNAGSVGADVQARWIDKNPALQIMLTAGEIEAIVPWKDYATTNGVQFYNADCVHHFTKQEFYVNFIQSTLDAL